MNPNVDASPNLPLPEPAAVANSPVYEQAPVWQTPEFGPPAAPKAATQPAAPSFTIPAADPVGPMPPATPVPQAATTTQSMTATPATAADDDLIEKEWVIKAKQIVASALEDPYQQNRQLAALKADYMQKRYGKTIKLSE